MVLWMRLFQSIYVISCNLIAHKAELISLHLPHTLSLCLMHNTANLHQTLFLVCVDTFELKASMCIILQQ